MPITDKNDSGVLYSPICAEQAMVLDVVDLEPTAGPDIVLLFVHDNA